MKWPKGFFALFLVLSLCFLLGGCGSGGGPNSPTNLIGDDVDGDGVRDDVEEDIFQHASDDEHLQAALATSAKSLQKAIVAYAENDGQGVADSANDIMQAATLLFEKSDSPEDEVAFIERCMFNSEERAEAYTKINQSFSGRFFGVSNESSMFMERNSGNKVTKIYFCNGINSTIVDALLAKIKLKKGL